MTEAEELELLELEYELATQGGGPQGNAANVTGPQLGTNMMTFGLSDAIGNLGVAGVETMLGRGEGFMDNWNRVAEERARDRGAYREENPGSAAAHEIAGGVVGGGKGSQLVGAGAAKVAPRFMQQAIQQPGKLGATLRTGATAAEGAGLGAAASIASDQDPLTGAMIGGGMSAAAVPLISAGKTVASGVGGMLGIGNKGRALREVERTIANSGKTPQQLYAEMQRAQRLGKQDFTLTDALGEAGAREMRGLTVQSSPAANTASDFFENRMAQQAGRIEDDVVNALGSPDTARQARTLQEGQRRAQASQNYGAARAQAGAVDLTQPETFLATQIRQTPGAETKIQAEARNLLQKLNERKAAGADFQDLFAFKRELDDMTEAAYRGGEGNLGELYKTVRNQIDDQLAAASQPYANARNTYRQQTRGIEAIQKGLDAENMLGRDRVDVFRSLNSAPERQSYLTGRANKATERLGRSTSGQNVANRLLTRNNRTEYPAVAGVPGRDLISKLEIEDQMAKTRNLVNQGSRTDKNIQAGEDASGALVDALTLNKPGLIARGVRSAVNAATGKNEAVRTKIIEALMSSAPDQAINIAREAERAGKLSRGSTKAIALALGAGTAVGAQ